jgi:hypothetical protein
MLKNERRPEGALHSYKKKPPTKKWTLVGRTSCWAANSVLEGKASSVYGMPETLQQELANACFSEVGFAASDKFTDSNDAFVTQHVNPAGRPVPLKLVERFSQQNFFTVWVGKFFGSRVEKLRILFVCFGP